MKLGKDMGDGLRIGFEREGKKINKSAKKVIKGLLARRATTCAASRTGCAASARTSSAPTNRSRRGEGPERAEQATGAERQEPGPLRPEARQRPSEVPGADAGSRRVRPGNPRFVRQLRSVAGLEEGHPQRAETLLAQLREQAARADRFDARDPGLRSGRWRCGHDRRGQRADAEDRGSGPGAGRSLSKDFNQAGVNAQAGLVKGLEKNAGKAEATGRRLANRILRAFKKRLGIKSPSTEFALAGRQVVEVLQIGVDDPRVQAAREEARRGSQDGLRQAVAVGEGIRARCWLARQRHPRS
ncbi:hypothetical protein U1Q18_052342, partial [Sarracenia purpurea var. burkii]